MRIASKFKYDWPDGFVIPAGESQLDLEAAPAAVQKRVPQLMAQGIITVVQAAPVVEPAKPAAEKAPSPPKPKAQPKPQPKPKPPTDPEPERDPFP